MCRDNYKWSRVCAVRFYQCFRIVTWQIVWCDHSEILGKSQHRLSQKNILIMRCKCEMVAHKPKRDLCWWLDVTVFECLASLGKNKLVRQKLPTSPQLLPEELTCHCMMSSVLLCCSLWCIRYRMWMALSPLAHVNRGACLYSATWLTPPRRSVHLRMRRHVTHQPYTPLF